MRSRDAVGLVGLVTFLSLDLAACTTSLSTRAQPAYGVGVETVVFVDQTRSTPAGAGDVVRPGRRLETTIWYPARPRPRGRVPLVVFAHGLGAAPSGYETILRSWARAGYVVAAPAFPGSRAEALGGPDAGDYVAQPADMSFVIDGVIGLARGTGPLRDLVDPQRVGAAGHSLGGVTTLGLVANTCCRDRRVRAAVVMAGDQLDFPGGRYDPASNPPLLVIHGDRDPAVPYRAGVEAFANALPPKGLVSIRGGDHGAPAGATGARAALDFFDRYLRADTGALQRLAADLRKAGNARLDLVTRAGVPVRLPPTSAPVGTRTASVSPHDGFTDGEKVTVAWQGFGRGTLLNIVECSRNPPTGAGDCDLARAALFVAAGAGGTGSAAFTVHAGAIGSGMCDAVHSTCVVVVNEGGSSAPQDSVIAPIRFR